MRAAIPLLLIILPYLSLRAQERIFESSASVDVTAPATVADVFVRVSNAESLEKTLEKLAPAGFTRDHLVAYGDTTLNRVELDPNSGFSGFFLGQASGLEVQFQRTVPVASLGELEQQLIRLGGAPSAGIFVRPSAFRYDVVQRPDKPEQLQAQAAAIPALIEEARQTLRALAAAAGSDPGPVTQAEFNPGPYSGTSLRLMSERASPFSKRVVRVATWETVRLPLDEARVEVEVIARREVTRQSVLQRMVQLGLSERDLAGVSVGSFDNAAWNSYLFVSKRPVAEGTRLAELIRQALRERPAGWDGVRVNNILSGSSKASAAAREAKLAELLSRARDQAALLAREMGGQVAALRAATTVTAPTPVAVISALPAFPSRGGSFSFAPAIIAPAETTVSVTFEFYVE